MQVFDSEQDDLIEQIVAISEQAGQRILEVYATEFVVHDKDDKTPVTEADLVAHEVIHRHLSVLTPEIPVLSEESSYIEFAERNQWSRYWLVDPLDGTREFVKRNGEFTVNIALIENHQPVMGVVHAPVLGVTYLASRNQGAYKQSQYAQRCRIAVRHLGAAGQPVVAGSRSHSNKRLSRYLERLGNHDLISMGSSLKSCLVAEGKADIYPRLGLTSEWDTAAAQCIVEEAGGLITDVHLQPLQYNTKPSLINPHFFVFGDRTIDWSQYLEVPMSNG